MERLLVPAGSVAYVCIASVGKVCVVQHPSFTNQQINSVVVDEGEFDPSFVYYALRHATPRIKSIAGGAATPIINKSAFSDISVQAPDLPLQRRIASILSAYDDLIENNTRRIAILEEMARRIYEEWFVRFRFPGHENAQMVESELGLVPEEWNIVPLSDICASVEDGDWIETKDQGGSDYRLLQISNVGLNSFVETDNFRYVTNDTFRRLRCREILPGQLLVARMPKPIGRAWLVTPQPWKMITAVDVAIVDPDLAKTSAEYLLHFLNSEATLASFAAQASGTTRLRITRKQIAAIPLCSPPARIAHRFRDFVGPMNQQIAVLVRKITNLRATRDLLLPKLISGELDVSAMPEPEAAAA